MKEYLLLIMAALMAAAWALPQDEYEYQILDDQSLEASSKLEQFSYDTYDTEEQFSTGGDDYDSGTGEAPSLSDDYSSGPVQYSFQWDVEDPPSGNFYGHQEERNEDNTQGSYYMQLPDGRRMVVEYYVDETGYHPTYTMEGEMDLSAAFEALSADSSQDFSLTESLAEESFPPGGDDFSQGGPGTGQSFAFYSQGPRQGSQTLPGTGHRFSSPQGSNTRSSPTGSPAGQDPRQGSSYPPNNFSPNPQQVSHQGSQPRPGSKQGSSFPQQGASQGFQSRPGSNQGFSYFSQGVNQANPQHRTESNQGTSQNLFHLGQSSPQSGTVINQVLPSKSFSQFGLGRGEASSYPGQGSKRSPSQAEISQAFSVLDSGSKQTSPQIGFGSKQRFSPLGQKVPQVSSLSDQESSEGTDDGFRFFGQGSEQIISKSRPGPTYVFSVPGRESAPYTQNTTAIGQGAKKTPKGPVQFLPPMGPGSRPRIFILTPKKIKT